MVSRPRRVRPSLGPWTLGLCLIAALGMPAEAQEPRSFANMLLRWPEPERDAERETDTEAEEREEFIETDRNSFTFAPITPGAGRLIVESAYSYINIGKEGAKHSFPETVFRYGIGDRLELRLGYNFETGRASEVAEGDIAGNFGINAEQQIFYGFKYAVTRQRPEFRLMPHSAFLAQAHTPVGSVEGQTQIRLGYVWGWILPNGWTFDQAVRFGTDREGTRRLHPLGTLDRAADPAGPREALVHARRVLRDHDTGARSTTSRSSSSTRACTTSSRRTSRSAAIVAFGINEQTRGVLVNVGFGIRF